MTAKRLATVPDPEPPKPATRRIKLDGDLTGKWADMTTDLTGEDFVMLYEIQELDPSEEGAPLRLYGPILKMIDRHCVAHNFGGRLLAQSQPTLMTLWRAWNDLIAEGTLDPTDAGA